MGLRYSLGFRANITNKTPTMMCRHHLLSVFLGKLLGIENPFSNKVPGRKIHAIQSRHYANKSEHLTRQNNTFKKIQKTFIFYFFDKKIGNFEKCDSNKLLSAKNVYILRESNYYSNCV